jgi:hypothetical protein
MASLPARRLLLVALLIVVAPDALGADPISKQVYEYRIKHPVFGDVGTYVNTITRNGERTDVETKIKVLVTIIGNVVYRQDAERREHWNNGRLASFRGVTETNGARVEVSGQAQGDSFVITAPQGTVVAPADVHPTNPWSPRILRSETMMASATGRLVRGRVVRVVDEDVARLDGTKATLRRYEIESDQRQFVWFDDEGIARAFRIEEGGAMIDFVLVRHTPPAADARAAQSRE